MSFLGALQQLGHSCGQSVMAADLAAFVTHKQLLGGVVAVEAALQHIRQGDLGLRHYNELYDAVSDVCRVRTEETCWQMVESLSVVFLTL